MKIVKLNEIAVCNKDNFDFSNVKGVINYLDTSSITDNSVSSFTKYENYKNIPSRAKRAVSNGTIVYSNVRPILRHIGILSNLPQNVVVSTGFTTIDVNEQKIDPYYLYYVLSQDCYTQYLSKIADSAVSAYPSITVSDLSNLKLTIFEDLSYQKKLGQLLKDIDKKIQNNKKQIETLENLAKTIYDYWFVQFDFPNEEGKPYKSSGGKMVWNEELKREIPEGWGINYLDSFIKEQIGGDWGKDHIEGSYTKKVICIRGTDFSSVLRGPLSAPTRYILEKNSTKKLNVGDVLIEISGGSPTQSTGRICYINRGILDRVENPLITSNFCKCLRLHSISTLYFFYNMWLDLYSQGLFFRYESKTTRIKNLMIDSFLSSYKIPIPTNESLFKKFDFVVSNFYDRIQTLNKESMYLEQLKHLLLPLLMNGQISLN